MCFNKKKLHLKQNYNFITTIYNFFVLSFVSESVEVSSNTETSNITFSLKQINENIIYSFLLEV